MSKYHSRKIIINGEKFDSKKEHARFNQLSLLEKAGVITNLQRQVKFELIPAQYENVSREEYIKSKGKKTKGKCIERACNYIADFVYETDGKRVVEDTKGFKTKDYIIKRKLLLYRYGIKISEV